MRTGLSQRLEVVATERKGRFVDKRIGSVIGYRSPLQLDEDHPRQHGGRLLLRGSHAGAASGIGDIGRVLQVGPTGGPLDDVDDLLRPPQQIGEGRCVKLADRAACALERLHVDDGRVEHRERGIWFVGAGQRGEIPGDVFGKDCVHDVRG